MSIARRIPTAPRRQHWKLALPILAVAAGVAFFAGTVRAETDVFKGRIVSNDNRAHAYAFVRDTDHGTNLTGDSADWDEIKAAKKSVKGDFLWFRDGGKTWVVQDPAMLARAGAAWAPVDRLGEQMDGYGKQMEQHGKVMEALGEEMSRTGARIEPNRGQTREFERKMESLGRQMGKLGEKMAFADEAERASLQRQMDKLGEQMGVLGAQHPAAVSKEIAAEMEKVGRRMNDAGKPMEELGKKMDVLGKQMEKESRAAEKVMRDLIREALANGLARPIPLRG